MFIPREIRSRLKFYQLPYNFYEFSFKYRNIKKLIAQSYYIYAALKIKNKAAKIICVDPKGLVIAGRMNKVVNLEIIYASFEIFFEDEFYVRVNFLEFGPVHLLVALHEFLKLSLFDGGNNNSCK